MNDENKVNDKAAEGSFEEQLAELIKKSGGTVPPKKPKSESDSDQAAGEEGQPVSADEPVFVTPEQPADEPIVVMPEPPTAEEASFVAPEPPVGESAFTVPPVDEPVFVTPEQPADEPIVIAPEPPAEEPAFTVPPVEEPIVVAPEQPAEEAPFITPEPPIEESAFTVPPIEDPVFVMPETDPLYTAQAFAGPPKRERTQEEIEAEIEAIINGMSAAAEPKKKSSGDMDDLMSQIQELEKQIVDTEVSNAKQQAEAERLAAEKQAEEQRRLDMELEAMLGKITADEVAMMEQQARKAEEDLRRTEEELRRTEEAIKKAEQEAKAAEEEARKARENAERQKREAVRIEIVPPERGVKDPIDVGFSHVEKEGEGEVDRLKAKIAALEMLLSQKTQQDETPPITPKAQQPQQNVAASPIPGMPAGDITSMFKQWFDLEMAAKMKNIITEDDKKEKDKDKDKDKPPVLEATPAYPEPDVGSPNLIKLSDNVFYNVREKKTYVMQEIDHAHSRNLPATRHAALQKPKPKKKLLGKHRPLKKRPPLRGKGAPHRPPRRPLRRKP